MFNLPYIIPVMITAIVLSLIIALAILESIKKDLKALREDLVGTAAEINGMHADLRDNVSEHSAALHASLKEMNGSLQQNLYEIRDGLAHIQSGLENLIISMGQQENKVYQIEEGNQAIAGVVTAIFDQMMGIEDDGNDILEMEDAIIFNPQEGADLRALPPTRIKMIKANSQSNHDWLTIMTFGGEIYDVQCDATFPKDAAIAHYQSCQVIDGRCVKTGQNKVSHH